MKSKCPKLATQWITLGTICKWLLEKRIRLLQYIEEKGPSQTPPVWWWIVVAAIGALAKETNIIITTL